MGFPKPEHNCRSGTDFWFCFHFPPNSLYHQCYLTLSIPRHSSCILGLLYCVKLINSNLTNQDWNQDGHLYYNNFNHSWDWPSIFWHKEIKTYKYLDIHWYTYTCSIIHKHIITPKHLSLQSKFLWSTTRKICFHNQN